MKTFEQLAVALARRCQQYVGVPAGRGRYRRQTDSMLDSDIELWDFAQRVLDAARERKGKVRATVELTLAEAKALSHAAGNSTSDPDALDAVFGGTRAGAARARAISSALSAHQKLDDAIASSRRRRS